MFADVADFLKSIPLINSHACLGSWIDPVFVLIGI